MQLITHFVQAAMNGAVGTASLPSADHMIVSPSHSYSATANRAAERTVWYSAFGAAASWNLIG